MKVSKGLDGWLFGGSFTEHASQSHWQDYTCAVENGTAVVRSAVPEPAGFAFLGQEVFADDFRGSTVVFRPELRYDHAFDATPFNSGTKKSQFMFAADVIFFY